MRRVRLGRRHLRRLCMGQANPFHENCLHNSFPPRHRPRWHTQPRIPSPGPLRSRLGDRKSSGSTSTDVRTTTRPQLEGDQFAVFSHRVLGAFLPSKRTVRLLKWASLTLATRSALAPEADFLRTIAYVAEVPCVDGSGLARRIFTSQGLVRCSHVFGLLARFA